MVAVVALVIIVAFALTGCQFIAQKAVESATGVKVEKNGNGISVTGKNGATAQIGTNQVPDGWPTEVPVYSGTLKAGNKVAGTDGTVYNVVIETADSPKTVGDFYEKQLGDAGWTKVTRNDATSGGKDMMIFAAKKDTQQTQVTAASDGSGKTTVTVTVTSK